MYIFPKKTLAVWTIVLSVYTLYTCRMILDAMDKPMTAREIAYKLKFSDLNAVKPRLTEMKARGTVEVIGKAYDALTERNVSVYRRT